MIMIRFSEFNKKNLHKKLNLLAFANRRASQFQYLKIKIIFMQQVMDTEPSFKDLMYT